MEVIHDYKQTDLGLTPTEWDIIRLGEATIKVGSGITPTGGEKVYKKEGRPFMRSQNVGWGQLLLEDIAYIDDETHSSFSATEIKLHDVLLNITGASIGRSAVADQRLVGGNVNQHVCIIRTDTNKLLPLYLNLFMLSKMGQQQIDSFQAGGNRQGLNFQQIKSFQLLLPPIHEQNLISITLSEIDALITTLDQLIAKKHLIKQGVMQELLTGKRRLPGFTNELHYKQTEVGVIPEDWDIITLENAAVDGGLVRGPFGGTLKKEFFVEVGYKVYEQKNAIYATVEEGEYFIDSRKYKELSRFHVHPADFIVSCSGTIGSIYQIPVGSPKGVINQALLKITLNQKIINDTFFISVFQSDPFQERIKENTHGGAMQNLVGMDVFRKTLFQLPPKIEQQAIADILCDMEDELAILNEELVKVQNIKQGMMQELLTGRIRLDHE
jgi:type I restriction enzyme S subunit